MRSSRVREAVETLDVAGDLTGGEIPANLWPRELGCPTSGVADPRDPLVSGSTGLDSGALSVLTRVLF